MSSQSLMFRERALDFLVNENWVLKFTRPFAIGCPFNFDNL